MRERSWPTSGLRRIRAAAVTAGAIGIGAGLVLAPAGLVVRKPLVRADAIVVMAGSEAYEERATVAASLFREGRAPVVVLTDEGTRSGWSEAEQRNPSYAELAAARLGALGVPRDATVMLPVPSRVASTRTVDEVLGVQAWCHAAHPRGLIVVTSSYHSRRTAATFEHIFDPPLPIGIEVAPASCCGPLWWMSGLGWRAVAGEYVKLAYQAIRRDI